MKRGLTIGTLLLLGACGREQAPSDPATEEAKREAPETLDADGTAIGVQTVQYAVTCRMSPDCPSFEIFVEAGKDGVFQGRQGVVTEGQERFAYDPNTFDAMTSDLLDILDGEEFFERGQHCETTEKGDVIDATLRTTKGARRIVVDTGCDYAENEETYSKLRAAPYHLPIAELVGTVGVPEEMNNEE